RKAGQFSWDVVVHGAPALFGGFKQAGALDPLKSALVLPEVTDDANWIGGFDAGYADIEKSVDYAFVGYLYWCAYVNRDLVPEAALSKFEQLWDPRWKGKIAILDPRQPSAGAGSVAAMLAATNEDRLRAFFRDQQPVITQDRRQLAEWMIRGQYPIGLGQDVTVMQDFITQGVEVKQVQALVDDALGASLLSSSFGTVGVFNRPPHPNAAKVLVNWLLSREGQSVWSQHTSLNSRRTDVAPVSLPDAIVDPKKTYLNLQIEQTFPTYLKAVAIAKEELK
ncbi:MAG TPA: extracellular solute-binding protein, partial [Chloroflexota bacterium]|nr:extracellular solute-binding protein [Chloroflexota bacterium]